MLVCFVLLTYRDGSDSAVTAMNIEVLAWNIVLEFQLSLSTSLSVHAWQVRDGKWPEYEVVRTPDPSGRARGRKGLGSRLG